MSAPTPPSRLPSRPAAHRSTPADDPWGAPRPTPWTGPGPVSTRPPLRRPRTALGTAFDVVARVGTAVTLAALVVVVGSALATAHATPTPTGVTAPAR